MAASAAALLDELMGRGRNLAPTDQKSEVHWDDPEICKYFLCGFCPHELFVNTRADLGQCPKVHDEILRKEYEQSSRYQKCGYEEEFMRFLQSLIADVEKRIRRGHQRLALNAMQGTLNGNFPSAKEDKAEMLTEKINELVNQAEQLGCEGKVEEAQGVMKLCDQLREERRQLEMQPMPELPPLKQMSVCEVCGAFLIVGDMPQRQDEHILGKQHAGYATVRATVEKYKKKLREDAEEREAKELRLAKERENREKEREREREERRRKEKEKEDKEREERRKEREKKRRSRSRSRGRRSRSRDRRDRSRERRRHTRSRSRHRKHSRSKDRHRSSRSARSRSRSRSRRHSSSRRSRDRETKQRTRSQDRDVKRRSRSRDRLRSTSRDHSSRDKARLNDDKIYRRSHSRESREKRSISREKRSKSEDETRLSCDRSSHSPTKQYQSNEMESDKTEDENYSQDITTRQLDNGASQSENISPDH